MPGTDRQSTINGTIIRMIFQLWRPGPGRQNAGTTKGAGAWDWDEPMARRLTWVLRRSPVGQDEAKDICLCDNA